MVLGVIGICVFAHMSGKVAAVSGRATFEVIRERLGPRAALANLAASFLINLMTLTAEVGGIALALQLASSVHYLLWVPLAALAVWLVVWRVKFSVMENVAGLLGLTLIGFAVALVPAGTGLVRARAAGVAAGTCDREKRIDLLVLRRRPVRGGDDAVRGVLLLLRCGRGGVDAPRTSAQSRLNVLVGFPFGGLLSLAIAGCAAVVLLPEAIQVTSLSQVALTVAEAGGKLLLAVIIIGVVAATFGAALETTLSAATPSPSSTGGAGASSAGPARRPGSTSR